MISTMFKAKSLLVKQIVCVLLVGITATVTSAPRKAEANPLLAAAVGFICYMGYVCVDAGVKFFQNEAEDKRFLEDRTNLEFSDKMVIDVEIQKTMLNPVFLTDLKKLKLSIQSKNGSIRLGLMKSFMASRVLGVGFSKEATVSEDDGVLVSRIKVDAAGLATALAYLDRDQKDGALATLDFVVIQDNKGETDRFGRTLENHMTVLAPLKINSDTFSNNSKSFEIVADGFKATVRLE